VVKLLDKYYVLLDSLIQAGHINDLGWVEWCILTRIFQINSSERYLTGIFDCILLTRAISDIYSSAKCKGYFLRITIIASTRYRRTDLGFHCVSTQYNLVNGRSWLIILSLSLYDMKKPKHREFWISESQHSHESVPK
jgi:hypothetical protein